MKGPGNALAMAVIALLAGCDGGDQAPTAATGPAAPLGEAPLPPQAAEFPALASRDCAEVVRFYVEALGAREFARAALAWDDPVIDGARLEAVFGGYQVPRVAWREPAVEGAAGSLYCTVAGTLSDAADPAKAPVDGTVTLRRANDVPGATPDQLRWTLRSSTFVEPIERSSRGEP
ncbi:MAG TPA: hypothetical protein VEB68_06205 [Croceibacterium sp.]|nr:hypothetical protein [Croceibacterium sp.]